MTWDIMYSTGNGVPVDTKQAFQLFLKAAEKGSSTGKATWAWTTLRGKGVKQDYDKAVIWFRKAADRGDQFPNGTWANSMKMEPGSSKITRRRNSGIEKRPTRAT